VIVGNPAATPVTIPVDPVPPTVACEVLLLLQLPPGASVSVMVDPWQTEVGPLMADGDEFTVTLAIAVVQPVLNPYVILAVPALIPVTTPEADPTTATLEFELVHVPPETLLVSVPLVPIQ
jgi:hypothetical protein